ncbi:hypothetical protein [Polaribacter sp. HaHaR_3_91]|nr:hypothetical protein [Polaribacter sp. HaHaR_3_91]QXP64226.1 hypothetical protein H0I27_03285 [Polaribacter sp. HaHaR_3_91]
MIKNNNNSIFKLIIFFLSINFYAQESGDIYLKYIDSASNRIDNYPRIAEQFLDSIPNPLEKNIKGKLADYYHLKAVLSSYLNRSAEVYHYNILGLKYAELEKNYKLAGTASIELFYNLYIVKKDTTALNYLKKAEKFYTIVKDKYGLIDVMQMKAYTELYNNNYKKSNDLILAKLDYYKSIKEDSFYQLYALFMLITNFVDLNDDANIKKYYTDFKTLENDTTLTKYLYNIHDVTLNISFSDLFLRRKQLDSAAIYLKKVDGMRSYMNNFDKENQFKNYIAYYDELEDTQNKNNYIDSLKNHNQNLISENIDASFNINESFLENSRILEVETKKNFLNRNWIAFLVTLLVVGVVFVFVKYKSLKRVLKDFSKRRREYSLIENNHDKLKLKVKGLENYIVDLKKEIKSISSITNIDDQRNKIKSLHKDIHHSSSVLLVKGEDHLDLINNLNAEFFNQMSIKHPELNPSEVIICYYLFMGFKTKEISVFLNTSVRSVESKRYRITNKLGIKKEDFKLVDYLKETFKDTTSFSS